MLKRSSNIVQNDYNAVAKLARESKEPVFVTKNGTEESVIIDIDTFRQMEQMYRLKLKLAEAEAERVKGCPVYTVDEIRMRLNDKYNA